MARPNAGKSGAEAVFIDTSFVLALVNPDDQYHAWSVQAAANLALNAVQRVTTEAVLIEIGNGLSRGRRRMLGLQAIRLLRNDPKLNIAPVDAALIDRAVELFAARMDKEWGLTDCISFVVMRDLGLTRALTTDDHFAQAGFRAI